jgi:hypothetical protein
MSESSLKDLGRLVGTWRTTATHPARPGVVVHGTVEVTWLDGERFLIQRASTDNPEFPGSISIVGYSDADRVDGSGNVAPEGRMQLHYFDTRGVFRLYDAAIDATAFRFWRESPGFSQRFTGTFLDGGRTLDGLAQLRRDDLYWRDDLKITWRRA